MCRAVIWYLAILPLLVTAAQGQENFVVNGSFEDGFPGGNDGPCKYVGSGGSTVIPGWVIVGGSFCIDWLYGCDDGPEPSDGLGQIDLQGSFCPSCNNNGGVRQSVAVPGAGTYTLVLDLRHTTAENDSAIVSIDGVEHEFFGTSDETVWDTRAIVFDAKSDTVDLYIFSPTRHSGVSFPRLDNVRMYEADCNGDGIVDLEQIESGVLLDLDGSFVPDCCESGRDCDPCRGSVAELIVNGSFEDGFPGGNDGPCKYVGSGGSTVIPGWVIVGGSFCIDWLYGCDDGPEPSDGLGQIDLQGSFCPSCNNNGGVRQSVAVPGAGTYTLVLDLRHTTAENDSAIVSIDGVEHEFFGTSDETVWDTRAIVFDAKSDTVDLYIFSPTRHSGVSFPRLDNVRMYEADCNGDGIVDLEQIESGVLLDLDGSFVPDCCEGDVRPICVGDLDLDGVVGATDLGIMLAVWGTDGLGYDADLNGDGTVNAADLGLLIGAWGPCP